MTSWREAYQQYLNGLDWQATRQRRLEVDGYRCQRCDSTEALDVHHLTYARLGHEVLTDLISLCRTCHERYHSKERKSQLTPPLNWNDYLNPTEEFSPLVGQDQVFRLAASTKELVHLIVQPTGYGKTISAIGLYGIFRSRKIVDRLLVIVPTDTLRRGYLEDLYKTFAMLGIAHGKMVKAERLDATLRYHQSGEGEVFVTTYQSLNPTRAAGSALLAHPRHLSPLAWFDRLMENGQWMVMHDEAHHLSEENKWAKDAQSVSSQATSRLYLSATPIRTDGRPLLNVPRQILDNGDEVYKASIEISVKEAVEEGAIRKPHGHIQHYWVDVECDGEDGITRIDTEFLKKEGVTDFNQYEARRGFRYQTTFLKRILADAIACLFHKLDIEPDQHQAMVFAMTCEHASSVAEELNRLEPGIAEWIGTLDDDRRWGRPESENRDILADFKNGRLRILVQVDKAGEGFDNQRISVLVFLNLLKSLPKLQQQIGRGLRLNRSLPHDRICDIFAPADTPIADYVHSLEVELGSYQTDTHQTRNKDGYKFYEIPNLSVIGTEYIRTDFVNTQVSPEESERRKTILEIMRRHGSTDQPEIIERILSELGVGGGRRMEQEFPNDSDRKRYYSRRVDSAVKCYASNIVRWLTRFRDIEADTQGKIIKAVHKRWGEETNLWQNAMMAQEVKQKYDWIQQMNVVFGETREVPPWLPI